MIFLILFLYEIQSSTKLFNILIVYSIPVNIFKKIIELLLNTVSHMSPFIILINKNDDNCNFLSN